MQRKKGILAPDVVMASRYRWRAKFERVRFDEEDQHTLLRGAAEVCEWPSRRWRLHLGVAVFNHVHLLIGWPRYEDAARAKVMLHRTLTVALRDRYEARGIAVPQGRPFLSRGGSAKAVRDEAHFEHLCKRYLPSHQKYGGILLAR